MASQLFNQLMQFPGSPARGQNVGSVVSKGTMYVNPAENASSVPATTMSAANWSPATTMSVQGVRNVMTVSTSSSHTGVVQSVGKPVSLPSGLGSTTSTQAVNPYMSSSYNSNVFGNARDKIITTAATAVGVARTVSGDASTAINTTYSYLNNVFGDALQKIATNIK